MAAWRGHSEVVKLLLEAGADKDAASQENMTALHLAAWKDHAEVVKLLLEAGADKDSADRDGKMPVRAIDQGSREVLDLLQPKMQTQKRQKLNH